jgi:hypothetical protein
MEGRELVKEFVKAWARHAINLSAVEQPVLNELQDEGAARQVAQRLFQERIQNPSSAREIAFQLALAEFAANYAHQ